MVSIRLPDPLWMDILVSEFFLSEFFSKFFCPGTPELMVVAHRTSIRGERTKPRKSAAQWLLIFKRSKPVNSAILASQHDPCSRTCPLRKLKRMSSVLAVQEVFNFF